MFGHMRTRGIGFALALCLASGCTKGGASLPRGGTGGAGTGGSGTGGAVAGLPGSGGSGDVAGTGGVMMPAASGGSAAGGAPGSGGAAGQGGATVMGSGGAPGDPADAGVPQPIDEAFADMARQFAADYLSWGRVDDELRWAPSLCRMPLPGIARPSKSNDATTHGQKLYSVFAKNHAAYPDGPQDGQIVVKQSWTAELVAPLSPGTFPPSWAQFDVDGGDHFYGYAERDGSIYRAAEFAGLYIMFRLAPDTPNTDEGWVYATVTPYGQITAAGKVASCMGCHEVATHERLFGVPLSPILPN